MFPLLAGLVSNVMGSAIGSMASSLMGAAAGIVGQFGGQMAGDALGNLLTGKVGDAIKNVVDGLPIPQFAKDLINSFIDKAVSNAQTEVDPECQCAVDEEFGDTAQETADLFQSNLENCVEEAKDESKEASGEGKAQNWFTILAKALGNTAGKHLDQMVSLQNDMAKLTDKDKAGEMAEAQAEFQAQSQMFKLASEATSTAVKSIGEALSSLARKQ